MAKGYVTYEVTALRAAYTRMAEPEAYWFSPDTMRFFRSRLDRTAYVGTGGCYFVTSEQFNDSAPRLYTVRVWRGKKIDTVGEFQEYATLTAAREAAKAAAVEPLFHTKGTDEGAFDAESPGWHCNAAGCECARRERGECPDCGGLHESAEPQPAWGVTCE